MLLAIDTSTSWAGLALHGAEGPETSLRWRVARSHTVQLMPWIDRLIRTRGLVPQQLSGVAVATGPGSFTGLRVGISAAKGIVAPLGIPLIGVPTLLYTAWPHRRLGIPIRAVAPLGRRRVAVAAYIPYETGDLRLQWMRNLLPDRISEAGRMLYCGELTDELRKLLREHAGVEVLSPAESLRDPAVLAEMGWERLTHGELISPAALQAEYLDTGTYG